jgi:hypothetical protein
MRARSHSADGLLDELGAVEGTRPPLVVWTTLDWDMPLFQRPQQLALAAASSGWPVIFVKPTERPRFVRPGLLVWNDLDGALRRFAGCALLAFSTDPRPQTFETMAALRGRATVVYDVIDEQHADIGVLDERMLERHRQAVRDADVVLVTADRLVEQVAALRPSSKVSVHSPNAVDLAHFAAGASRPRPRDMRRFGGRPIVGYYGAHASWFDYGLMNRLAATRPEYDVVLIGIDYDHSLGRSGLLRHENVYFLGPRAYRDLPAYLACFDVATIPFVLNDVTESTSPIKLFEYMAGGRPIVTTNLRECRKYRSVRIGKTHDEVIALVDDAIARGLADDERELLAQEAAENSWAARVSDLARAVDAVRSAR